MENFSQIFEIIYNKYFEITRKNGANRRDISRTGFARFLGVSQGKMQAWEKGQWPSAQDCALIERHLGFSLRWLVTGEGDPEGEDVSNAGALQAKGQPMPMLGLASCGVLSMDQVMPFSVSAGPLTLGPNAVAVVASGESMVPAGIAPGQVCYCDPGQEPLPGDAVYVEQAGQRGTLKVLTQQTDDLLQLKGWLPPNDKGHRQEMFIDIPMDTVRMVAPVIFVRRRL